jgi:UDP-GlcNAc:undecaprenyl-phosphate/decaprenyl-phosphate GlcNAc-1-phosphate transferase
VILKFVYIISFLLVGIFISYTICTLLLRFSASLGIRNKNDIIVRWSNQSKPSLGGVSFFIAFLILSILYSIVFSDENIFQNIQFVGLFLASCLAFGMGLADDAYNTRPYFKLIIQICCGIIFIGTNTIIHVTHNLFIDSALTILFVIIIMNSLNMLDNMDGITGTSVITILSTCLFSYFILQGVNTSIWSIMIIGQIGALIGFLILNIHPSKLFMGDAGSQFIGLFVAFFSINHLWNFSFELETFSWTGALICLVAFTAPGVDTLTVVINRIKKGKSPMVGGKDHTTHHLVYAGLNDLQVWFVFLLIGLISFGVSALMIYFVSINIYWPLLFLSLYFILVFILLYRLTIKHKQVDKKP